jgi:hypothetical protein
MACCGSGYSIRGPNSCRMSEGWLRLVIWAVAWLLFWLLLLE